VGVRWQDGSILKALRDPSASLLGYFFTSAVERNGKLIVGSIAGKGVAIVDLRSIGAL
jgi:hypothetical protein